MIRGFEIHAPHEILFWDRKTGVAFVFLFVVGAQFHPHELLSKWPYIVVEVSSRREVSAPVPQGSDLTIPEGTSVASLTCDGMLGLRFAVIPKKFALAKSAL